MHHILFLFFGESVDEISYFLLFFPLLVGLMKVNLILLFSFSFPVRGFTAFPLFLYFSTGAQEGDKRLELFPSLSLCQQGSIERRCSLPLVRRDDSSLLRRELEPFFLSFSSFRTRRPISPPFIRRKWAPLFPSRWRRSPPLFSFLFSFLLHRRGRLSSFLFSLLEGGLVLLPLSLTPTRRDNENRRIPSFFFFLRLKNKLRDLLKPSLFSTVRLHTRKG